MVILPRRPLPVMVTLESLFGCFYHHSDIKNKKCFISAAANMK